MSRVRIEIFDGDFEDAPTYTRESTAEAEGDRLHEAFERAVAMARAALPPTPEDIRARWEAARTPPLPCGAVSRPSWRCHLPAGHSGGHEFVPARCRSNCPVAGHSDEMGRCRHPRGHEGDHQSDSGCRWSHEGMGGHTPDGY